MVHIVDDDDSLRTALGGLLRSMDYRVSLHRSASEFLGSPRKLGPSCLLLDIRLPGLSGTEFQHRLRELGIDIPVIMMSGDADPAAVSGAMGAGAAAFLHKPFREEALVDAVEGVFRRSGV